MTIAKLIASFMRVIRYGQLGLFSSMALLEKIYSFSYIENHYLGGLVWYHSNRLEETFVSPIHSRLNDTIFAHELGQD